MDDTQAPKRLPYHNRIPDGELQGYVGELLTSQLIGIMIHEKLTTWIHSYYSLKDGEIEALATFWAVLRIRRRRCIGLYEVCTIAGRFKARWIREHLNGLISKGVLSKVKTTNRGPSYELSAKGNIIIADYERMALRLRELFVEGHGRITSEYWPAAHRYPTTRRAKKEPGVIEYVQP